MQRAFFLFVFGCSFLNGFSQTLVRGKVEWCFTSFPALAGIEVSCVTADSALHISATDSTGSFFIFIPATVGQPKLKLTYNGAALTTITITPDTLSFAGYTQYRYLICAEPPAPQTLLQNPIAPSQRKQDVLYLFGATFRGKREGDWLSFYPNGMLWSVGTYKEGKRQGLAVTFYDNGNKSSEGFYNDDKMTGAWKFWDEAGNVTEQDFGE